MKGEGTQRQWLHPALFYRDLKHFAESADVPAEAEERAAIAAGFTSSSTLGTDLRELIAQHQDTLAVAVR